jgi:hypothetical protein
MARIPEPRPTTTSLNPDGPYPDVIAPLGGIETMDLANHHLARSLQSYDAQHAERVNEYRRVAEERRAAEPPVVRGVEPRWYRAWFRLADGLTLHHYRGHSHAH